MSNIAVLCGNPNVGKSTVFNALTGLRQHTGNWAGKTVESARGEVHNAGERWTLIDLPGAYSLLNGSPDELAASDFMLLEAYDAAVVVCDATCLSRSLPLAMQAARICPRTILCINLMDEARKQGVHLDLEKLSRLTGLRTIGVCAKSRQGIDELKKLVKLAMSEGASIPAHEPRPIFPAQCREMVLPLMEALNAKIPEAGKTEVLCLRLLCAEDTQRGLMLKRIFEDEPVQSVQQLVLQACSTLNEAGWPAERIRKEAASADFALAEEWVAQCTGCSSGQSIPNRNHTIDRMLCSPFLGIPLMLLLLLLLFYITMAGANIPSEWLSRHLLGFEPVLAQWLTSLGLPLAAVDALAHGMYRSLAWVVSVMLPPMAIFFPLFTLLEDLGYLPRIAFNLDRCFRSCRACGKQALCMCMGLGCNAVGVTGCRIIQSPRERMLAILTNALVPCNGRLPLLLLLVTLMFAAQGGNCGSLTAAVLLVGMLVICVAVTLLLSAVLSRTLLKGMGSAFVLELPSYRVPAVGQVLLRSVLDRTLFVLGRAAAVAAPAGLVLWVLGNTDLNGLSLLQHAAGWMDPLGRLMGMDGVILLAFLLGLPANEIVLPIMLMVYLQQGTLMEVGETQALAEILRMQGWTWLTALCTALFTLFHWPCSTTILTIRKETGSTSWTVAAVLLPTLAGFMLCTLVAAAARLLGLA